MVRYGKKGCVPIHETGDIARAYGSRVEIELYDVKTGKMVRYGNEGCVPIP